MSDERWRIFDRVNQERVRQDARWGEQNHPDVDRVLTDRGPSEYRGMTSPGGCSPARMAEEYGVPTENRARAACDGAARIGQCTWAHIAVEEMAEVIHAATLAQQGKGPESAVDAELIQLAAVVTAWIEARARRGRTVTAPHTPPAALDATAIGDLMGADEARSLLDAMTPGTLEVAEIRDGRLIDAAPQELAVAIHDDARAHQYPNGTWHSVVVCRGMDGPTREGNAAALASVKRALATVAAQHAAAPDLARDVLSLAAALATAERERDEARAERDAARAEAAGLRAMVEGRTAPTPADVAAHALAHPVDDTRPASNGARRDAPTGLWLCVVDGEGVVVLALAVETDDQGPYLMAWSSDYGWCGTGDIRSAWPLTSSGCPWPTVAAEAATGAALDAPSP